MSDIVRRIADNVAAIRARMAQAALRSGRSPDGVRLVAVTKSVGLDAIRATVEAGCHELGESRVQQLGERADALRDLPVRWHMIGPLQRNKVRRALETAQMIQSADSRRLIEAIDRIAGELSRRVPLLIEVNVSGEAAKHGFAPDEVEPCLVELARLAHVEIRGLMCMASLDGDLDAARREFASLRRLRDRLRSVAPPEIVLDELSMGMSGDFEPAIEEGATMVRVGSALFEGIEP